MNAYTIIHVIISLIAIFAGIVVMFGMLGGKKCDKWATFFMVMTAATSLTGFGFIRHHIMPAHIVGIISLVVLAITAIAFYVFRLGGMWRKTYVIGAVVSLYLNVFVLIVQAFLKIPAFHKLAPTQTEFPFKLAQGWVLVFFVLLGALALIRFQPSQKTSRK